MTFPWKTVQIGALANDTGEKPRTIQHWSDLGILRPDPLTNKAGRSTYRVFRAEPLHGERAYALLASAYFKLRIPLGDIKRLIEAERLYNDPIELIDKNSPHLEAVLRIRAERVEDQKKYPDFIPPYEAAILGEPDICAVVALRPHDPVKPIHTVYLRQGAGLDLTDPDLPAKANNKMLRALMAENPVAMIMNLSEVFAPLQRPIPDRVVPAEGGRAPLRKARPHTRAPSTS